MNITKIHLECKSKKISKPSKMDKHPHGLKRYTWNAKRSQ